MMLSFKMLAEERTHKINQKGLRDNWNWMASCSEKHLGKWPEGRKLLGMFRYQNYPPKRVQRTPCVGEGKGLTCCVFSWRHWDFYGKRFDTYFLRGLTAFLVMERV